MTTPALARLLKSDPGVDPAYRHIPKRITNAEPLDTGGALLKWYHLAPEDRPVPEEISRLARRYLLEKAKGEVKGLGFTVVHRCGSDFYFLLSSTWRNANELWEAVDYKDGEKMADFAPFPREAAQKPCYCVWELVAVMHERDAWTRFLSSSRDEAAAEAWLADRCAGPA
jgi:hypothetical protein